MPTRRTSPRRTATRPSAAYERDAGLVGDDDGDPPRSVLSAATPWLPVLAVVLAAGAGGVVVVRPGGGDPLSACRSAAWSAIPDKDNLPKDWDLGSTDLNANGMTISVMG